MKFWLLDTGPIIAFLDGKDPDHALVSEALEQFNGRFVTTSAVIVESMHLVSSVRQGAESLVSFLAVSQTQIHECCGLDELARATQLMSRYAETPMDFADASLVLLSNRLQIYSICTLDRRGFRTYRSGKKAFRLVLDEQKGI